MAQAVLWWLALLLVGVAALPLTISFFRFLPDRGYAFSRAVGLILGAYIFWLMGFFGAEANSRAGVLVALGFVAVASLVIVVRRPRRFLVFWGRGWAIVVATELAWVAVFAFWGLVRSYTPQISHTEQPSDFALLNGILQSPGFPPQDPWAAGESISYYYGGHLMTAFLTHLTGVRSEVSYNLALMSTAAIAATGTMSVVFNILRSLPFRGSHLVPPRPSPLAAACMGALGASVLLFIGNFAGALEYLGSNGLAGGLLHWVNIDGLSVNSNGSWYPTDTWWWWRSTRVINTFIEGRGIDYTITEFPFFSFLLGDLHPHVMGLPFTVLALGIGFNLLRSRRPLSLGWLASSWPSAGLVALCVGSLGFINSWDLPTALFLLLAVILLNATGHGPRGLGNRYTSAVLLWLAIAVAAVALFAPFYSELGTQAEGFLPIRRVMTRPIHLFIVLGPLLLLNGGLLGGLAWTTYMQAAERRPWNARPTLRCWLYLLPLLPFVFWAAIELGMGVAGNERLLPNGQPGTLVQSLATVGSRLWHLLPLFSVLGIVIALIRNQSVTMRRQAEPFLLLLVLAAFFLLLVTELFYVADFFGNRMNTVFKVYYQVWTLLSISGTVGFWLWIKNAVAGPSAFATSVAVLLTTGLLAAFAFVPPAIIEKTGGFRGEPTLDGRAYLRKADFGEYEAVEWLRANARVGDVVVEGVPVSGGRPSGDYDAGAARISGTTGLPTVLGWPGHEYQWHGNPYDPIQRRFEDVEVVYRTGSPEHVRQILDRYGVTYVIVGELERRTYGLGLESRLQGVAERVFVSGSVSILRVIPEITGDGA